jgi:hypothetical protein
VCACNSLANSIKNIFEKNQGYTVLAVWTKEADALREKLEQKELAWLDYSENFDV